MAGPRRSAACCLTALLAMLAFALVDASPRHLLPATTQRLSGPAAAPVPSNGPPIPAGGDELAKEGEPCMVGGNIQPILCAPGLRCNTTAPTPGRPGWNPDAGTRGTCIAVGTAPAPAPALAKEGDKCTTATDVNPVACAAGLSCDFSASNSSSGGTAVRASMPMSGHPDAATEGICRRAGGSSLALSPPLGPSNQTQAPPAPKAAQMGTARHGMLMLFSMLMLALW